MKKIPELFGWYGTVAIVLAYVLVSFSLLQPTNIWYQILNGTGAIGIVAISLYKGVYQPAVLNIIWTLTALVAILKLVL
ncbi:MAG: hypothetical protein UT37_C0002G0007 [Parcubacteria group bacterium GW2011_GWA2_39_18]|nr:MAG: hypothetical protein UT37_C0002G0007 [Parcubacteria group bacterium GW2011_GWA2_39_18]